MSFSLKDAQIEKAIFARRAILAAFLVVGLLCVLAGRMIFLQVSQHELFASKSENNRVQLKPVAPIRGFF